MMSTLVRRKHRRDSWPVEELRNWLGVDRPEHPDVVTAENPEKLQGWNPFYKRALKPALEEVNRLAAFTVTIEPKTGYCGRRVEKVHLIVTTQSGEIGRAACRERACQNG